MKIAIVTDTYFPRINGVSVSTRTFAREFARLGHTVHIHAPAFPAGKEENEPFEVVRYPSLYLAFDPEDRVAYGFRKQARAFTGQKYDIVHTQTPFFLGRLAVKWGRKSGAKVVHTYHTFYKAYSQYYFWYLPRRVRTYCTDWFSKSYCNSCDLVIAPSTQMADEVASYRVRTRIAIIPTGVDVGEFTAANADNFRKKYGFSPRAKLLLYVGRLAEEKNIDFLLRVFGRLAEEMPDAHLVIAGAGPSMANLKSLAVQTGTASRVHFLGYVKGNLLHDCYAAADLFLFSSVTETQGLAVLESLAAGTPVVAVGRMGINDILANSRGGIITEPDEDEFFGAVMKMMNDRDLYKKKKAETFSAARAWSSQAMAERTLQEYRNLLSGGAVPAGR